MTVTAAHVTWTATGSATAQIVQRYQEAIGGKYAAAGWFDIAELGAAVTEFDDYEARRTVQEAYRVLDVDAYGNRSIPPSSQTVTCAAAGWLLVSNEDESVNTTIRPMNAGFSVDLPDRVSVVATEGAFGQVHLRHPTRLGEVFPTTFILTGSNGPTLWQSLVEDLRADLSYLCLLSPWGHRWFVGAVPTRVESPIYTSGYLAVVLTECTNTPTTI